MPKDILLVDDEPHILRAAELKLFGSTACARGVPRLGTQ